MKASLLLFMLLFCCFACNRGKVKQDSAANKLVGKWDIYETVQFQNNDDSISTKCNACPQIVFADDETGSVKGTDEKTTDFKWQLDSTSLVLKHQGDSAAIIADGTYQFAGNDLKTPHQITLTDTIKDIKYILRK